MVYLWEHANYGICKFIIYAGTWNFDEAKHCDCLWQTPINKLSSPLTQQYFHHEPLIWWLRGPRHIVILFINKWYMMVKQLPTGTVCNISIQCRCQIYFKNTLLNFQDQIHNVEHLSLACTVCPTLCHWDTLQHTLTYYREMFWQR